MSQEYDDDEQQQSSATAAGFNFTAPKVFPNQKALSAVKKKSNMDENSRKLQLQYDQQKQQILTTQANNDDASRYQSQPQLHSKQPQQKHGSGSSNIIRSSSNLARNHQPQHDIAIAVVAASQAPATAKNTGGKKVKTLLEQEILSQFSQLIRVRMQSSRQLNLTIPPVVSGKEHRSYLQIKMEHAFLGSGQTAFKIEKALLKQIISNNAQSKAYSLQAFNETNLDANFATEESKASFAGQKGYINAGYLDMEANYACQSKQFNVAITGSATKFDDAVDTTNSIEGGKKNKVDNSSECRHNCRFTIEDFNAENRDQATQEMLPLQRSDLFQLCLNLVKKIQNINCEDKFYCLSSRLPSQDTDQQFDASKLKFEAATMNICPLDFSRVLLRISSEQQNKDDDTASSIVNFTMLMPNTNFKIRAIPQMKLVSTPLSRLLLGKQSAESSKGQEQPFTLPSSGFITLDSEERVIPLMPQDPFLQETPAVGIWLWNVEDLRSPFVWSVCTRFVFCRNFRPQSGKMPTLQPNQFLMVNFKKNHQAQFLILQVDTDGQWVLYQDQQRLLTRTDGVTEDHLSPDEPFMTFSAIKVDQTVTVQKFLDLQKDKGAILDSQGNKIIQIRELAAPKQGVEMSRYATESQAAKASSANATASTGKQATSSLTAEYNSRYSRNKEEKKQVAPTPNPVPVPSVMLVKQQQQPLSPLVALQPHIPQQQQRKLDNSSQLSNGCRVPGTPELHIETNSFEQVEEKTSILRSNLQTNTPVSANTSRSRNSQSQNARQNNANKHQIVAAQHQQQQYQFQQKNSPIQQTQITEPHNLLASTIPGSSSVVYFKHMGQDREANASPRTKQAMALQQMEIARLGQEVASLKAQLLLATKQATSFQTQQQEQPQTSSMQRHDRQEVDEQEIEAELPNQETAQFAPSLQSTSKDSSYQQKLELGQLETLKAYYQQHAYYSQPASQIAGCQEITTREQQQQLQAMGGLDMTRSPQFPINGHQDAAFFSEQVGGGPSNSIQKQSRLAQSTTRKVDFDSRMQLRRSFNQVGSTSPKDLHGNPSSSVNNRSRNQRKQTNNQQKLAQPQNVDKKSNSDMVVNNEDFETPSDFNLGGMIGGNQQLNPKSNLQKSWSQKTLSSVAKAMDQNTQTQNKKIGDAADRSAAVVDYYNSHRIQQTIQGNAATADHQLQGIRQSRNTNLANIVGQDNDDIQKQPLVNNMHKRSFSSSHINQTKSYEQNYTAENDTNADDQTVEFAELMSRANVGYKASRNMVNDVNNNQNNNGNNVIQNNNNGQRKQIVAATASVVVQEQLELGKFINLIANKNVNLDSQTATIINQQRKHPKDELADIKIQERRLSSSSAEEEDCGGQDSEEQDQIRDIIDNTEDIGSQSSNESVEENGDHTYNPYSFKRLQDAIFKKEKTYQKMAAKKVVAEKQQQQVMVAQSTSSPLSQIIEHPPLQQRQENYHRPEQQATTAISVVDHSGVLDHLPNQPSNNTRQQDTHLDMPLQMTVVLESSSQNMATVGNDNLDHNNYFMEQNSQANYSQDFDGSGGYGGGLIQSASQDDSSSEQQQQQPAAATFGLQGPTFNPQRSLVAAATTSTKTVNNIDNNNNSQQQQQSLMPVRSQMVPLGKGVAGKNKKSDWTMDMPKTLEYQRPIDDEEDESEASGAHNNDTTILKESE